MTPPNGPPPFPDGPVSDWTANIPRPTSPPPPRRTASPHDAIDFGSLARCEAVFARCFSGVGRMATKFDWGQRKSGRRQVAAEPKQPAVGVRIYKNRDTKAGAVSRVCLLLSRAFIDAAKLRKGDRLEACVSGGAIALRLNAEYGVAISGAEFSQSRDESRTTRAKSTAYAAFGAAAWPDLKAWAETRSGAWVAMANKGTHWESIE